VKLFPFTVYHIFMISFRFFAGDLRFARWVFIWSFSRYVLSCPRM